MMYYVRNAGNFSSLNAAVDRGNIKTVFGESLFSHLKRKKQFRNIFILLAIVDTQNKMFAVMVLDEQQQ